MDTVRYFLAVVIWATLPPAFLYWYLIHPFAGYWRSVGPTRTYLVVGPICLLALGALLRWRGPVAGTDLGENWALFYTGLMLWSVSIFLERRIRKQLDFKTLAGVPELRPATHAGASGPERDVPDTPESGDVPHADAAPRILDTGMYGRMRHPRYVSVFVGTLGWSLMANYLATYLVTLSLIPMILVLVWMEERELVERFGDAYRAYQARVPALIPRLGSGSD